MSFGIEGSLRDILGLLGPHYASPYTKFLTVPADAIDALFAGFDAHLKDQGYLAMGGQNLDAGIIAVPRQRMTDEERAIVKDGGIPDDWAAKPAKAGAKRSWRVLDAEAGTAEERT